MHRAVILHNHPHTTRGLLFCSRLLGLDIHHGNMVATFKTTDYPAIDKKIASGAGNKILQPLAIGVKRKACLGRV